MIQFSDLLDFIDSNCEKIGYIKQTYTKLMNISSEITDERFLLQCKKISHCGSIIIAYVECENKQIEIIASATLIIEPKITLEDDYVGYIENIVILDDPNYRNLHKIFIEKLKKVAEYWNCNKLIITCPEIEKSKYDRMGFNQMSIKMSYRIEKKNSIDELNFLALDTCCKHCSNVIQRNNLMSENSSNKKNILLYFLSIKDSKEFDEIFEKNKIISTINEKNIENYKILFIVHVVDLMQKYKFAVNGDVDFLYLSTISEFNDNEFEWKKDNEFLDNVLNEKIIRMYI
jgi:hypothetical protein